MWGFCIFKNQKFALDIQQENHPFMEKHSYFLNSVDAFCVCN